MNYKLLSSQNYSFAACLLKIIFILPDSKVVFHASLVNNLPSPASPIIFDNISINEGFGFDTMLRSFFEVPQDGYYWLYLSVGIPFNKSCKCTINGQNISLSVFRTLAITGFDVTLQDIASRGNLLPLKKGQQLFANTSNALLKETTWFGFLLDNTMDVPVAFSLGNSRPTALVTTSDSIIISFDTTFVDTHFAWNSTLSAYTIAVTGIYFIVYQGSTSSSVNSTQYLTIYVNSVSLYNIVGFPASALDSWSKTGSLTSAFAVLVRLNVGDKLSLYLQGRPIALYSDITYQTSFSGFLYQPLNGVSRIAWWVTSSNAFSGADSPIPMTSIILNEGYSFGWRKSNSVSAPDNGIYYVYMAGDAFSNNKIYLQLILNGRPVASLLCNLPVKGETVSRSKAVLLRLNTNDELYISQPCKDCLIDGISFLGFRLLVI